MKPKFQIGDQVWIARCEQEQQWATCPDCGGTRYVTVIANGDTHTVPCAGCSRGYESPSSVVPYWSYVPTVEQGVIGGVEVSGDSFEYRVPAGEHSSWIKTEAELFLTESEALQKAQAMQEEYDVKEKARIFSKKEEWRTWAWHVTYYRRQIRDAQATIERATQQLNYAQTKEKGR